MSLTDTLPSNFKLSADDLQMVAKQLILQETTLQSEKGTISNYLDIHSSSTAIDSDDPISDSNNVVISESGSSGYHVMNNSTEFVSSELVVNQNAQEIDECRRDCQLSINNSCSDSAKVNSNVTVHIAKGTLKPPKRRGGWPKGRKRKPDLLHLPPKAPATGYTLYLNEMRKQFKDSSLLFSQITKIIGNKWSSLSLDEKKPYLERAEEDKRRYRGELLVYRQSGSYQLYLAQKRKKRMQNNVLSESDMDATDDIDVS